MHHVSCFMCPELIKDPHPWIFQAKSTVPYRIPTASPAGDGFCTMVMTVLVALALTAALEFSSFHFWVFPSLNGRAFRQECRSRRPRHRQWHPK